MKYLSDPWVWRRHGAIDSPLGSMALTRASAVSRRLYNAVGNLGVSRIHGKVSDGRRSMLRG